MRYRYLGISCQQPIFSRATNYPGPNMVEFPYLDKVFFGSTVISISLRELLFFSLQSLVLACTKVSFGILPLIQPKSASATFGKKSKSPKILG